MKKDREILIEGRGNGFSVSVMAERKMNKHSYEDGMCFGFTGAKKEERARRRRRNRVEVTCSKHDKLRARKVNWVRE